MDASIVDLLPRAMGSMVVVLAIMWFAARLTKTRKFGTTFGTRINNKAATQEEAAIELLSRQPLGRNTSISVVRAGNKKLVLGITESSVSLLTELDDDSDDWFDEDFADTYNSHPSQLRGPHNSLSLVGAGRSGGATTNITERTQRTGATKSEATPITDQAWKGLLEQVRERTVRH